MKEIRTQCEFKSLLIEMKIMKIMMKMTTKSKIKNKMKIEDMRVR